MVDLLVLNVASKNERGLIEIKMDQSNLGNFNMRPY